MKREKKMEKIYNNLNIENLIKTEAFKKLTVEQKKELLTKSQWFNQFNEYQQEEILEGLEKNLDVSIYTKSEYHWRQMEQIRWGLEKSLDVSIYAIPGLFDSYQMKEIRKGLENAVDISIYANPSFDSLEMEQIRWGLESNIDVSKYAKPEYNWKQMSEIRESLLSPSINVDVPIYVKINSMARKLFE